MLTIPLPNASGRLTQWSALPARFGLLGVLCAVVAGCGAVVKVATPLQSVVSQDMSEVPYRIAPGDEYAFSMTVRELKPDETVLIRCPSLGLEAEARR